MPAEAKNILQTYLRRLTNLSGNNRSLLLLRLHAEQLIDLYEFSYLNGTPSFEIVKSLIKGESKKLCQVLDSRIEANNQVSVKTKKLQRIDRFIFEERGSNDLHIGWPFVHGKFADGTTVRCPLLFFPVSIMQQGQHWVLQLREDAGITFNKSFLLAYSFYNKVKLEEHLIDFNFEDFDSDSIVFRTQLYELLKDKIEINFNSENFQDELKAFTLFKKSEFADQQHQGELKLFPEAVLGIFPQAGSQLVPDYLQLIENNSITDLEEFFINKQHTPSEELFVKEEKIFTPFVLDAYQEHAIRAVKNGNSIVVQGPPGTGKSQLICNLLADAIATGKRALLVCQKRAALDVVYDRMNDIDLSDFLGLVHDFRNDRKDIYSKIARQIERIEEYKAQNRSIDVIQTERKFFQLSRRLDQVAEELEEFKTALYNDAECGLAIKELYLTSDLKAPVVNIKQEYHHFSFTNLHDFLRKLKTYINYAAYFKDPHYVWAARKSFAAYLPADEGKLEDIITDIVSYQKKVATEIFRLIGTELNLEDCESFLYREEEILGLLSVLKEEDNYRYFQTMITEPDEDTSLLWLSNMERVTLNCFDNDGPEVTVQTEMLGKYQEALYERTQARGNFIKQLRWEFFSKNKFLIKRLLVANNLAYNKYGLTALEQRIDSRLNLEHHLTALKLRPWLIELPEDFKKQSLQRWFIKQKFAIRAKLIFNSLREVKGSINVQKLSRTEFHSLLLNLLSLVKDIPAKKNAWQQYLSPYHVRHLILNPSSSESLINTLKKDFDNLCEFDKLTEALQPFERSVIEKLFDHIKTWDATSLETLFQNSLRLSWIDHIETKYPILRAVSSMKMDDLQTELQQHVAEKHQLSKEILLVRAREQAYEGLTYNRLNNRVSYRDLHHQVTKKKKIWPVRKVIAEFYEELFQLIPVWMASPESVSAIFPMHSLFDLVIFDEASQCFAERGVPAMYRGKQVIVAGDDQQLQPNELYQVRWEDETEAPETDIESLLELSARYLPTLHLQGHYRSESPALIEFSNRFFYENRLRLLPNKIVMNSEASAIEYLKVEGVWDNHVNMIEAQVVVERVVNLLQSSPAEDIGVVTFNAPQQMLIMDLLEERASKEGFTIPSSLFIKNIENVQGDEKDIIIFSIGYAPDKKGKMAMQFGSLNMTGGENRLNVAITRARKKIILVTSIWPEQLKVDDIKNQGPKLLRGYLQFAREVHEKKFKPTTPIDYKKNSAWYLNSHLKNWGESRLNQFTFETNTLPYADLNILENNYHLGIVLTDDDRYYKALSVKEAHAYTPALLTKKGWRYKMVFSRNYWKDVDKVEGELMLFIGNNK